LLATVWQILRTRDFILSTAGYTALTFTLGAFATWATVLLVEDKGMTETNAAITLGIVVLLGGATEHSAAGGCRIASRAKPNAYFLVCAISTLLAWCRPYSRLFRRARLSAVYFFRGHDALRQQRAVSCDSRQQRADACAATAVALNIVIIHTFGDTISRAAVGVLSDSLKAGI
jgi:hypothetical protein